MMTKKFINNNGKYCLLGKQYNILFDISTTMPDDLLMKDYNLHINKRTSQELMIGNITWSN